MNLEFNGEIWFWRGPAPWFFVTVPEEREPGHQRDIAIGDLRLGRDPGTCSDR